MEASKCIVNLVTEIQEVDEVTILRDDEEIRPLERELPWLVNIRHYGQDAHSAGNGASS